MQSYNRNSCHNSHNRAGMVYYCRAHTSSSPDIMEVSSCKLEGGGREEGGKRKGGGGGGGGKQRERGGGWTSNIIKYSLLRGLTLRLQLFVPCSFLLAVLWCSAQKPPASGPSRYWIQRTTTNHILTSATTKLILIRLAKQIFVGHKVFTFQLGQFGSIP